MHQPSHQAHDEAPSELEPVHPFRGGAFARSEGIINAGGCTGWNKKKRCWGSQNRSTVKKMCVLCDSVKNSNGFVIYLYGETSLRSSIGQWCVYQCFVLLFKILKVFEKCLKTFKIFKNPGNFPQNLKKFPKTYIFLNLGLKKFEGFKKIFKTIVKKTLYRSQARF